MSTYTIIIPDNDSLKRICGTNDSNLKLIESFLGVNIYALGNELSIDSDNEDTGRKFRFIMDSILDEISSGESDVSDTDLIHSVLYAEKPMESQKVYSQKISAKEHSIFDQYSITIPGGTRKVYPRTKGQADLVRLMNENDIVIAEGPAGSGKTFFCIAQALKLVLTRQKTGIILTRPVVEAGESLGFLPGDLKEKIDPYMRPLYDAMNSLLPRETARKMMEGGIVEIAPLAYMRGRTLNDSVIILDEAQNTTPEQMKMFLTRMGDNSKVFVTGDLSQIDLPRRVPSGLEGAMRILDGISGIAIKRLSSDDVVRSTIVRRIIEAYENEKAKEE